MNCLITVKFELKIQGDEEKMAFGIEGHYIILLILSALRQEERANFRVYW